MSYRCRLPTALALLLAACSSESGTEPADNTPASQFSLSVVVQPSGDGDGTVQVSGNASGSCVYAAGTATGCSASATHSGAGGTLTLVATPTAGSVFGGWSGDCQGAATTCAVVVGERQNASVRAGASFLLLPTQVQVTVADADLTPGRTTQATATAVPPGSRSFSNLQYQWSSSEPGVASVSGTTAQATVTAVSVGSTQITAAVRGVQSTPVTVTVEPPPGVIHGVLYDVDGVTPLDSVHISMGPVAGTTGTSASGRTGRQEPLQPPIPRGGYRFEVEQGRYWLVTGAVLASRYMTTPGDTMDILAGGTTELDLNVKRGYHLDMLGTDVGTIQAQPGATLNLAVDYRVWNRDLCPGCVPALAIGVDATPLAVYRFGTSSICERPVGCPGIYPGKSEENVQITVTVPNHGGTFYAMLVTTSTAADIQPGLDLYAETWAQNAQDRQMIPIGTLIVSADRRE